MVVLLRCGGIFSASISLLQFSLDFDSETISKIGKYLIKLRCPKILRGFLGHPVHNGNLHKIGYRLHVNSLSVLSLAALHERTRVYDNMNSLRRPFSSRPYTSEEFPDCRRTT